MCRRSFFDLSFFFFFVCLLFSLALLVLFIGLQKERTKYLHLCILANKMLADTMRSIIMRDIKGYAQRFQEYCRLNKPEDVSEEGNWYGEYELLPTNLVYGTPCLHLPIFDLKVSYNSDDKKIFVEPSQADLESGSTSIVLDLIHAVNAMTSFSVDVIDAIPAEKDLLKFHQDEAFLRHSIQIVKDSVADNEHGPLAILDIMRMQAFLVEADVETHCAEFTEVIHPVSEVKTEIHRFVNASTSIQNKFPDHVVVRMHRLAFSDLKQNMDEKAESIKHGILLGLAHQVLQRNQNIKEHFDGIIEKINVVPTNAEELAALQEYAEGLQAEVDELQIEILDTQKSLAVLEDLGFDITLEDQNTFWTAFGQPNKVSEAQAESLQRQEDERLKFMQDLQETRAIQTDSVSGRVPDTPNFARKLLGMDRAYE